MPLERAELESMVNEAFPQAKVELVDLAGDNNHWSLTIADAAFKGKTRVQQHKMVYDALKGNVGDVLHALQLKTSVPQD